MELKKPEEERNNTDVEFVRASPSSYKHETVWDVCVRRSCIIVGGCVTVHKAQGVGEDYCVVTCLKSDEFAVSNQWAYTAVSRAKKGVALVGSESVFSRRCAPEDARNCRRETVLTRLLRSEGPAYEPDDSDREPLVSPSSADGADGAERAGETELEAGRMKRSKIPKSVRDEVWRRDCTRAADGQLTMSARCCCCGNVVDKDCFHCAHVVSAFRGGGDHIDNLKVCCPGCNLSMGTRNLDEFARCYFGTS